MNAQSNTLAHVAGLAADLHGFGSQTVRARVFRIGFIAKRGGLEQTRFSVGGCAELIQAIGASCASNHDCPHEPITSANNDSLSFTDL